MKKTLFVLFTAAMLFVTFACKQPANPEKYTGKGAQQNMAEPKTVTIPIDVVKASGFLTRSIRENIVYRTKQAALAANIPQIETTDEAKINYVDWDLSVGRTAEEALSETLIVKHVTVQGLTPDSFANVKIDYDKIKQWFGREIQVGDEFWLGFRCSNQDGKELARMAHHIKVGNPTKLDKVELIYGFDGWYIKATLTHKQVYDTSTPPVHVGNAGGDYPTATADFYLGADEKSGTKVNGKPVNSHVVTLDDGGYEAKNTLFYCKVPEDKIVEGQPYHIKAHFNDVEFGGQDGVTSFASADVIYAKDADSAWNFQARKVGAGVGDPATALAKARGAVELDLADFEVVWNDMADAAMIFAKFENGEARLVNDVYKVRLAKTEAELATADSEQYTVEKFTVGSKVYRKVKLDGLQYGQEYFMRVEYSYDIAGANGEIRRTLAVEKQPVVQFKTVNGLVSPRFTFDSGREMVALADIGDYPASLASDGTKVTSGGSPSNALKLNNGEEIRSATVKRYKSATLTFDQIFPTNIDKVIDLNGAFVSNFYAKKAPHLYPGDEHYAMTKGVKVWEFESGEVVAQLVYLPPYITNDKDDLITAGQWTLTDGKLVLLVCGNKSGRNSNGLYDGTLVKISNAFLTSELASGGAQLGQAGQGQAAVSNVKVKLSAKAGWLAPYKTEIALKAGDIDAKMGGESISVKVSSLVEQFNGYENFTLTSRTNNVLVDNVQYEVVAGKVADYTRRVR